MNGSLEQQIQDTIALLWERGCPIPGPSAERHLRLARVAIRRWNSRSRRHVKPDRGDQMRDLTKGLIEASESDRKMVGPLKRDYGCVAEAALNILLAQGASNSATGAG
jgi:hypothetical protein